MFRAARQSTERVGPRPVGAATADPPQGGPAGAGPGPEGPRDDQRERAAGALRLELSSTEAASDGRAAWHVADGLAVSLARVTCHGRMAVEPDELVGWGLGRDEAFHRASANLRAAELPTVSRLAPTDGAELVLVVGTGVDAASHVLWLDDLVDDVPAVGALVTVPNRRTALVHPLVRRDDAVEAVNLLLLMADDAFRDAVDAVSPALFWWRDGDLVALGGEVVDDEVRIDPPTPFLDVLDGLL
jgi:hypothetical protein